MPCLLIPPYYDAVLYADLSDFFYVWHKRCVGDIYKDVFRTPLTPKQQELIEERPHRDVKERKDKAFYEEGMAKAFADIRRVSRSSSIVCVMFAHKTTTAWETLIAALLKRSSDRNCLWPFHTERGGRLAAKGTAALASSVTLVCKTREMDASTGLWDDVRQELKTVALERLDFFWNQGIRGVPTSLFRPSDRCLPVYGKYERVTKLSGEEVTVGHFLDEVRSLVTNYASAKILKTNTNMGIIDPESRFFCCLAVVLRRC